MEINHLTLCDLLRPISSKWKKLGMALSLTQEDIITIGTKCSTDDECLDTVLMQWNQSESQQLQPYSWEALAAALRSNGVDNTHLADEITKKLTPCTSTSTMLSCDYS